MSAGGEHQEPWVNHYDSDLLRLGGRSQGVLTDEEFSKTGGFLSVRMLLDNWHLMTTEQRVDWHTSPAYSMERMTQGLVEDGNTSEQIEEFVRFMEADHEEVMRWPGPKLREWLMLEEDKQDVLQEQNLIAPVAHRLHQWPSGITRLDHAVGGGGYGLTVFAGEPKQGKSLAALGAGLSASQNGWFVAYVNAEMTEGETYQRAEIWSREVNDFSSSNFLLLNSFTGCKISDVKQKIVERIQPDTPRVLVVLDSISRLHENDGSKDYWEALERWSSWARVATRKSGGLVSFLVVSEMNSKGSSRGQRLEYAGNMLVYFTEPEQPDVVDIQIKYSRSTPSGEVGPHRRNFERSRFEFQGFGNTTY